MKIAVIGTGYVGLVTGACFAEQGNTVCCMDVDEGKVSRLNSGIVPIHEPGLTELVQEGLRDKLLHFTTDLKEALRGASVAFVCVGTPQSESGLADMTQVYSVGHAIGRALSEYTVVIMKSTVPVGTADEMTRIIGKELASREVSFGFDVVSNPEFLKEGAAIKDFRRPDRIVIGVEGERAKKVMSRLYEHFIRNDARFYWVGKRDAEMTKYAANAMLATRISFMNEIAAICDEVGADVENVRLGMGSDSRIGFHFLYAGCGYGGSCFPKDVRALVGTAATAGVPTELLPSVDYVNERQKDVLFGKVMDQLDWDLRGKVIAIWGLAFKPDTDDMREAPSLVLCRQLIKAEAKLRVHDPVATAEWVRAMGADIGDDQVEISHDPYHALEGVDALVLVTEWKVYRQPDFPRMKALMRRPIIVDGRNQYNVEGMTDHGFRYVGIGRGNAR